MEQNVIIKELSLPLYQARGWMKFLGVMSIISGIALIFTLVGILICWIPIWMGVLLFQAGNKAEMAQLGGEMPPLSESLAKLKTYFIIAGVLLLIALVGSVLGLIASGGAILGVLRALQ